MSLKTYDKFIHHHQAHTCTRHAIAIDVHMLIPSASSKRIQKTHIYTKKDDNKKEQEAWCTAPLP